MSASAVARSSGAARRRVACAAAFAIAALVPALALRGFTVDDALITARYAAHVASGEGYRLSAGGPVTDGVTPLGFVYVLAPFAGRGPLAALAAAKVLGAAAWTLAAAVLGLAVARVLEERAPEREREPESARELEERTPEREIETATSARGSESGREPESGRAARGARASRPGWALVLVPLALVGTSAPLGAWASAGMETGLVAAFGALAAALPILGWPRAAAVCAGVAAGWRPELLPWAMTLGLGLFSSSRSADAARSAAAPSAEEPAAAPHAGVSGARAGATAAGRPGGSWLLLFLALLPFVAVAVVRLVVFGRPAPLSVFAKAPDGRLGLAYAAACAVLVGPIALAAPVAIARLRGFPRALAASVLVHLGAVALAGGDWMPLSRLMVPVLPSLSLGALFVAREAALLATAVRLAAAVAGQVFVLVHVGPAAARVGEDRLRVIEELGPVLVSARVVASLDIGWVGAATGATIVDLAGVTDPSIAALPGGHTTRRIPDGLLDARGVDTLVLLLAPGERVEEPWTRSRFARGVEGWIATAPGVGERYAPVAEGTLPHLRYLIVRKSR